MPDMGQLSMRQSVRVLLCLGGLLFVLVGGFGLYVLVSLYFSVNLDSVYQLETSKDHMFNLLWMVVMASFVTTGYALLTAAFTQKQNNIVPGPTLYVLGVSLVAIAMFLFSVGSLLQAALIAVVGAFVMWLEYKSSFI